MAKPWRLALSVPIVSEGASLATPGNNPAEGFALVPSHLVQHPSGMADFFV